MSAKLNTLNNGDTKITFEFAHPLARYYVGINYNYREGPARRISPMGRVLNGYFIVLKRPSQYEEEGFISTELPLYYDGRKLLKKEQFWLTRPFTRSGANLIDKLHLIVFIFVAVCWLGILTRIIQL